VAFMINGIKRIGLDVVVCDGHSTDTTRVIAEDMGVPVLIREGFGKGAAIVTTVKYAIERGYEGLVTIDCDRTYDVDDIVKMSVFADEFDMVVGARPMKQISFLRRMANYLMTGILNILFASDVSDMATGMRIIRPKLFLPFLSAESFDIEPQMYAVALREKFRVKEVPISYSARTGDSKVRLYHLFLIIFRMIRERFS